MSYQADHQHGDFTPAPETEAADAPNPFLPILESLVEQLDDGLDHPEIWPMIASAAQHDDIAQLTALIHALRPGQHDRMVQRAFDVIGTMIHAFAVDLNEGVALFHQLANHYAPCPQVAGAAFFVQRAADPEKTADLSDRFCESPFIKFETLMDGTVAPCCSIWTEKRLGGLDNVTAEALWNSASAQEMRASILDGSFRYCNKQRCSLINDDALPRRDDVTDPELRSYIDEGITALPRGPRWLFLAHDVTCNLACPSCRSGIEVANEAQERRFEKIEQQVFQPLLSNGRDVTISVSGQGDPWSSPHYRSILRYLADHELNVGLNIHTNALLMSPQRWAQYAGLDRYNALVDVSIDSCTPWVYEQVRRPGKFDRLFANLSFIADKRAKREFREFHLNATIQLDNYHEMPALIDFARALGADTMRMYMMQNTGGHIAATYAQKNVGDASHPLHRAFLETLRDPRLGEEIAHLYDVSHWRAQALANTLPSDMLGRDFTRAELGEALVEVSGDGAVTAALCTAGRIRFPQDASLWRIEATALDTLGFEQQAGYRRQEAARLESAAAPD
ncbi:MAG: SPASM domain-containing protein [Pseudomonadota bacterium]